MSHSHEHLTDVNTRRLRVSASEWSVVVAWDYPGATLLRVRILRSRDGFAAGPCDGGRPGREVELVYEGDTGSFHDTAVSPRTTYRYTVFARAPGDEWTLWARLRVRTARPRALGLRSLAWRLAGVRLRRTRLPRR